MRIALISDIHGNRVALEAALADIRRRKADQIICLGDVALDGPQPGEVIERLHQLAIPVIKGNTDHWLLNPIPRNAEDEGEQQESAIEQWTAAQLNATHRELVMAYHDKLWLNFGDGFTLLCYHGSPLSFYDRIEPDTPLDDLGRWFAAERALVNAGGHTHEPMIRRYGSSTLVNPGSIGLPLVKPTGAEAIHPAWAEYALLERDEGGLAITLRRVPYALEDLAAAAHVAGLPGADSWLADWRPGNVF
jgi:predicted phosphodiesterase